MKLVHLLPRPKMKMAFLLLPKTKMALLLLPKMTLILLLLLPPKMKMAVRVSKIHVFPVFIFDKDNIFEEKIFLKPLIRNRI